MRDYNVRLLCKATTQDLESAMWLLVLSPAGVTQDCSGQEASAFLGRSYLGHIGQRKSIVNSSCRNSTMGVLLGCLEEGLLGLRGAFGGCKRLWTLSAFTTVVAPWPYF
jgi:hypothetical protein